MWQKVGRGVVFVFSTWLVQLYTWVGPASPHTQLLQAVPDGISTDLNHLQGLVLLEEDKSPAVIKRFAEDSLPLTIGERLNVLFSAREKWKLEEISPFVSPLTTNKLNVNALLTKFARPVNIGGVKYFCAKHGK